MLFNTFRVLRLGLLLAMLGACSSDHDGASDASEEPNDEQDGATFLDGGQRDGSQQDEDSAVVSDTGAASDDAAQADGSLADAAIDPVDAALTGPNVDRSSPKLEEFALDPKVLDPTIADSTAIQYAQLDTRSPPLGQLVIFLPGATNVPKDWRDHGRELAKFGFHVLIPHYNNRWSSAPANTCDGKPSNCGDDTRWEALVGEDSSAFVTIARADSAEGRVITMIKHLVTAHPGGDWGYYMLPNSNLRYDKIIIAGISHGAASAGMYAARRPFARNVMHSSGPAGSSSATKMTPISAWYGFVHTADPAYSAIVSSWNKFALPGQPTAIEGKQAPYSDSHRLTASAESTYPHGSVCAHSSSPKDASGNYVFEPAWRYLYGVPSP